MSRPFTRDHHQKAHEWLNSWVSWESRYNDRSILGARITLYDKNRSGAPAGPLIPNVMRPTHIVRTEEAYNEQSRTVRQNIDNYYKRGEEGAKWYKVTKAQREHFLKRIAACLFRT